MNLTNQTFTAILATPFERVGRNASLVQVQSRFTVGETSSDISHKYVLVTKGPSFPTEEAEYDCLSTVVIDFMLAAKHAAENKESLSHSHIEAIKADPGYQDAVEHYLEKLGADHIAHTELFDNGKSETKFGIIRMQKENETVVGWGVGVISTLVGEAWHILNSADEAKEHYDTLITL